MINKKINYEEENKRKKLCREIYEEDLKNFMMRVIRIAVNEMEKKVMKSIKEIETKLEKEWSEKKWKVRKNRDRTSSWRER